MKLTDKQAELIRTLIDGGDASLSDAIKASGFPSLAIATFMGWPWSELNRLVKAGKKVSDLPPEWQQQLRDRAKLYGLT